MGEAKCSLEWALINDLYVQHVTPTQPLINTTCSIDFSSLAKNSRTVQNHVA